jgi:hypothetical protein
VAERVDVLEVDGMDVPDVLVTNGVALALERLEGVGDVARVPVDDDVEDQASAVHVTLQLLGVASVDAAPVARSRRSDEARWRSRPC